MKQHSEDEEVITVVTVNLQLRFVIYPPIQASAISDEFTNIHHPVSYFSSKLKPHQKNYSTIELETLALVMGLKKFDCYLNGHPSPIKVYSDHNPLIFLSRMQNTNQRLLRWALQVQQYHLDLHHVKGSENIVADALSRGPINEE